MPTLGCYARTDLPGVTALLDGAATLGWSVSCRAAKYFHAGETERQFDLVLVYGARGPAALVLTSYAARGVPALILDAPRFRGPDRLGVPGEHGLFFNHLHWIPEGGDPARGARFADRLRPAQPRGDHVLVIGQRPGDASHRLDHARLLAWTTERIAQLRTETPLPIWYRAHPRDPDLQPRNADRLIPPDHPIQEDLVGAERVVTFCSTGGFEAILAGYRVSCEPSAWYAPWAQPVTPSLTARRALVDATAMTQWTDAELASGLALTTLQDELARPDPRIRPWPPRMDPDPEGEAPEADPGQGTPPRRRRRRPAVAGS